MREVVSFSGGKDSTAMLLRMAELNMPIDDIIYIDTGCDFPQMYEHIDKVEDYIKMPITRLKAEHDWDYYFERYSFPSHGVRWCQTKLKRDVKNKYLKGKKVNEYIGIAYDEPKRIKDKKYPLVEWQWTEDMCLKYCYDKGFTWGGLYKHFDRLSCFCCPLKKVEEYRTLYKYYPDLWAKILNWQKKTERKFTKESSALKLDIRFKLEEELGYTPRKKWFFEEVNKRFLAGNKEKEK